jgi:hypothetical protein
MQTDHDLRSNRLLNALEPAAAADRPPSRTSISSSVRWSATRVVFSSTPIPRGFGSLVVDGLGEWRRYRDRQHGPLLGLFAAMLAGLSSRVQLQVCVRCPLELLQYEFRTVACAGFVRELLEPCFRRSATVACNSMHTRRANVQVAADDARPGGSEALPYTHEFLSNMLGANRKSVTLAAQSMQTAGLISYRRGTIQILDRAGLEKASCECYAIVKERFDAFLTPPPTAVQGHNTGRTKGKKTDRD